VKKLTKLITVASVSLFIQSCGSGGGSSSNPQNPTTTASHINYFSACTVDNPFYTISQFGYVINKSANAIVGLADPGTFECNQQFPYARDKSHIFYQRSVINNVDRNSFEIVDADYSRDKDFYYFQSERARVLDYDSFQVVKSGSHYAKDKISYYSGGQPFIPADPQHFEVLGPNVAKDSRFLYYTTHVSDELMIVDNVTDIANFRYLGGNYFADSTKVYFYDTHLQENIDVVANADPNSFQVRGDFHAEDNNRYFSKASSFGSKTVPLVEINEYYSKVGDQIYYQVFPSSNADAASFVVVNGILGYDNARVYYGNAQELADTSNVHEYELKLTTIGNLLFAGGTKITGVDNTTFEYLGGGYFKDASNVWYYSTNLTTSSGADPANFSYLGYKCDVLHCSAITHVAKDNAGVYYGQTLNTNLDASSYALISPYFDKDATAVYYGNSSSLLGGADPATFEYVGGNYAKDVSHGYFKNSQFPLSDPSSFQLLNENYATDLSSVFYGPSLVTGIDPTSAHVIDSYYIADSSKVFFGSQEILGANSADFHVVRSYLDSSPVGVAYGSGNVYTNNFVISNESINPGSFRFIGNIMFADKSNLFGYMGKLGAKHLSKVLSEYYASAEGKVYFITSRTFKNQLSGALADSFEAINTYAGKDINNVYLGQLLLTDLIPSEVKVIPTYSDSDTCFYDADTLYYQNQLVTGITNTSALHFYTYKNSPYYNDGTAVYYKNFPVFNGDAAPADLATFVMVNSNFSMAHDAAWNYADGLATTPYP